MICAQTSVGKQKKFEEIVPFFCARLQNSQKLTHCDRQLNTYSMSHSTAQYSQSYCPTKDDTTNTTAFQKHPALKTASTKKTNIGIFLTKTALSNNPCRYLLGKSRLISRRPETAFWSLLRTRTTQRDRSRARENMYWLRQRQGRWEKALLQQKAKQLKKAHCWQIKRL